jgi:hypothetical protein
MFSPIFRSMISMATTTAQRDPIIFTDTDVEHSLVVKETLDIIYNLEVDPYDMYYYSNLYLYVIDFARKWEMSMITDFMGKEMLRCIEGGKEPQRSFYYLQLALRLGDNCLAAKCCDKMKHGAWQPRQPEHTQQDQSDDEEYSADEWEFDEEDGLPKHYSSDNPAHKLTRNNRIAATSGGDHLDLGAMPYSNFLTLPPTVVWIILHAKTKHKLGQGSMEKNVKQLLDLACESFVHDNWWTAADHRSTLQAFKLR